MDNKDKLLKYAIYYLSKYSSSKKNLEFILKKKIRRLSDEKKIRFQLYNEIQIIIEKLEKLKADLKKSLDELMQDFVERNPQIPNTCLPTPIAPIGRPGGYVRPPHRPGRPGGPGRRLRNRGFFSIFRRAFGIREADVCDPVCEYCRMIAGGRKGCRKYCAIDF